MAKWEIEFDLKQGDVLVDHPNMLEDQRKSYKEWLVIKVFQVHVEVGVRSPPPKTAGLVAAAKQAAENLQDVAIKDIDALVKELKDLQKEEQQGNKKAAETGKKLVEKVEKNLKNMCDEFGGIVRKAVQKALLNSKEKLSSTSRTMFRGMELSESCFEEDIAGEIPDFFGDIVKTLVTAGTEAAKLSSDEVDTRLALATAIKDKKAAIEKIIQPGKEETFDLALWAKNNPKEPTAMAQQKTKYVDFLTSFGDKLDTALKSLDKLEKLSGKEEALKTNKSIGKEYDEYRAAADAIQKSFAAKIKAATLVDRLFGDDWRRGATFVTAYRELEKQSSTVKDGRDMQDAGKALEKLGKG
jgi:hypothetical protein